MALQWFDYVNDPENAKIAAEEGQPDGGRTILEGATDGFLIYGIQQLEGDPKFYLTLQVGSIAIGTQGYDTREEAKKQAEDYAERTAAVLQAKAEQLFPSEQG